MSAIVRFLTSSDHADWRRLWRGYLDFYKATVPEIVYETTWARLLNPAEPMFGGLAIQDGVAVGLVHAIQHRSCWTVGDYLYLQDLFVRPESRGSGAGRKLVTFVYDKARARGCSRVHWLTHETNTEAMLLYDRLAERSGFVQYRKVLD